MDQAMDEGAKEGAIIVMMMMDQGATEGAMSGSRHGSGSNRRSDGWCERWFRE